MKTHDDDQLSGTEIYRKVVSKIVKTNNISDAYKMVPEIEKEIGNRYLSAIRGAIDFYYDELVQDAWNGKPLDDYMKTFI